MFKYLSGESHAWKESKENLALGTSNKSLFRRERKEKEKREKDVCVLVI